jgi:hypothetical protein
MDRTNRPARQLALGATLFATLLLATSGPAAAVERGPYSIEILVDGVPVAEHAYRGRTYVEAREEHEYSVRLRNHTSRRVAVALSVDGLNVIDAKTTSARRATKWILGPYQTITLDGWQTGPSTARRFFFTTEDRSYGAWLGKTSNLGVISAAFFRERRSDPAPIYRPREESREDSPSGGSERPSSKRRDSGADAPAAEGMRSEVLKSEEEASDDLAATGIGREIRHRVRRVRFDAEASPAAVMEIRYEYRDALVRLGVLPRPYARRDDPLDRRERARGFDDLDFAPDPYR